MRVEEEGQESDEEPTQVMTRDVQEEPGQVVARPPTPPVRPPREGPQFAFARPPPWSREEVGL